MNLNKIEKTCGCSNPIWDLVTYRCGECGQFMSPAQLAPMMAYYDGSSVPEVMRELNAPDKLLERANAALAKVTINSRPTWNTYLMTLAFLAAQRSLDKHTKHGCVLADTKHAILSSGYNSPPRGYPDHLVDLERPGKYLYFEHSERNAIANAARNGIKLEGAICYVTGYPCNDCYRMLWQAGIHQIIYAPISLGATYEGDHLATVHANNGGPSLHRFPETECKSILQLLESAAQYFTQRIEAPTT